MTKTSRGFHGFHESSDEHFFARQRGEVVEDPRNAAIPRKVVMTYTDSDKTGGSFMVYFNDPTSGEYKGGGFAEFNHETQTYDVYGMLVISQTASRKLIKSGIKDKTEALREARFPAKSLGALLADQNGIPFEDRTEKLAAA